MQCRRSPLLASLPLSGCWNNLHCVSTLLRWMNGGGQQQEQACLHGHNAQPRARRVLPLVSRTGRRPRSRCRCRSRLAATRLPVQPAAPSAGNGSSAPLRLCAAMPPGLELCSSTAYGSIVMVARNWHHSGLFAFPAEADYPRSSVCPSNCPSEQLSSSTLGQQPVLQGQDE